MRLNWGLSAYMVFDLDVDVEYSAALELKFDSLVMLILLVASIQEAPRLARLVSRVPMLIKRTL